MHKVFEIGRVIWHCNFQFCKSHFVKMAVKMALLPPLTEEGSGTAGWWASAVSVIAFEELCEGESLFFFKSLSIFLPRVDLISDQFSHSLKKISFSMKWYSSSGRVWRGGMIWNYICNSFTWQYMCFNPFFFRIMTVLLHWINLTSA